MRSTPPPITPQLPPLEMQITPLEDLQDRLGFRFPITTFPSKTHMQTWLPVEAVEWLNREGMLWIPVLSVFELRDQRATITTVPHAPCAAYFGLALRDGRWELCSWSVLDGGVLVDRKPYASAFYGVRWSRELAERLPARSTRLTGGDVSDPLTPGPCDEISSPTTPYTRPRLLHHGDPRWVSQGRAGWFAAVWVHLTHWMQRVRILCTQCQH